jgi:hypothetical protein
MSGKMGGWEKGIKPLGFCEVMKQAILFRDCKKAMKCIYCEYTTIKKRENR